MVDATTLDAAMPVAEGDPGYLRSPGRRSPGRGWSPRRAPLPLLLALALGACALVGCQTHSAPSVRSTVSESYTPTAFSDVAVAMPTAAPGKAGPLREALYQGLIARAYSPLDPAFVDRGGRGNAMLLTTAAAGPAVTGARTALYDAAGTKVYESSVAVPNEEADAVYLAELLLRDLPRR